MNIIFIGVLIFGVVLVLRGETKEVRIIGYITLAVCTLLLLYLFSSFEVDTKLEFDQIIIEETHP